MNMNEKSKEEVLFTIANGRGYQIARSKGPSKWIIGGKFIVHLRFRSSPKADGWTYAYNINPNTLSADFEVWICGSSKIYYLIPMHVLEKIYNDPNTYVDYQHPEIRVIDINTTTHSALYGSGGDFTSYYCSTL